MQKRSDAGLQVWPESPFNGYAKTFDPTKVVLTPAFLIAGVDWMPFFFSLGLVLLGSVWYYARNKAARKGAIYHIFERLGRLRKSASP